MSEIPTSIIVNCKQCPHLRKEPASREGVFHATCAAHTLGISGNRPRFIKCNIEDESELINIPLWCEHSAGYKTRPHYETWETKKEKWEAVPSHLSWDEIEIGGYYRIPRILEQPGLTIRIKTKNAYSITYTKVSEDGTESNYAYYLYKRDTKLKYITPINNY